MREMEKFKIWDDKAIFGANLARRIIDHSSKFRPVYTCVHIETISFLLMVAAIWEKGMNENGGGSQKFLLRGVNIPKFRRGGNGTLVSIIVI